MDRIQLLFLWTAFLSSTGAVYAQKHRPVLPQVPKPASVLERKIAPALLNTLNKAAKAKLPSDAADCLARVNNRGEVQVYIRVKDASHLKMANLAAHGLRPEVHNQRLRTIQGWLPLSAVEKVAALPYVEKMSLPSYGRRRNGSVRTEGDVILRADRVRLYTGATGTGVTVGVISDGVQNRAVAHATGDLPARIVIDPFCPGSGDEGTAELEIIHDIAPGANLAFSGPATSLEFIDALAFLVNTAGCDVVMDDVGFYDEPYFEDGPVAQAVASYAPHVVYISACGNDAERHYQAYYADVNPGATGWPHDLHAFVPHDATLNIRIPPAQQIAVFLQWADPWGSARNDYDLFLYDDTLTTALAWSNARQTGDDDPYEAFAFTNRTGAEIEACIVVDRAAGQPRPLEMFLWDVRRQEHIIMSDSVFGHPAAPGVLSVGAVNLGEAGHAHVANYSSIGPSTIAFPSITQRNTPRVVAIDGVSVTGVGEFPTPFFGTSAAAAHAAGIAALLLQYNSKLSPAEAIRHLERTAVDLEGPGFDIVSGFGRIDAEAAMPQTGARYWHLMP